MIEKVSKSNSNLAHYFNMNIFLNRHLSSCMQLQDSKF